MAVAICNTISGAGFGLFISTFIPSLELAMSLVPLIQIPCMLFSGIFVTSDNVPYFLYEFQYIAPTKYAFQAAAVVKDLCI